MGSQQGNSEQTIRRALDLVVAAAKKRPDGADADLDLAAALIAEVVAETGNERRDG